MENEIWCLSRCHIWQGAGAASNQAGRGHLFRHGGRAGRLGVSSVQYIQYLDQVGRYLRDERGPRFDNK
jgi:hypothetical protein